MNKLPILILLAIIVARAQIVAVLEITPRNNEEVPLTITEFRHLTDELRTQAREALPRKYTILTRDNLLQLLPPDEQEAQCLAESCAVDIGRAIGAEYITQGFIGIFEGMLTLTIELYESMSGNMLGSFVTESETARGLLLTIRERSPGLFAKMRPAKEQRDQKINTNIPAQTSSSQNTSFYLALSLDILGAAALSYGIYQYFNIKNLQTDYNKFKKSLPQERPDDPADLQRLETHENIIITDINNAQTRQNIAYAVGSALLAAGIVVHIWF